MSNLQTDQDPPSGAPVSKLIHGVRRRKLTCHGDSRGSFTEFFHCTWDSGIEPAQWSVVSSEAGVLRGMHLHKRHDEFFLLVQGHASVGLRDLRPGSPTQGRALLLEFGGEELTALSFPCGILHGWYFHEKSLHVQAVSEEYESYNPDDNFGCDWADPALEIPWPMKSAIVSERASAFPSLEQLLGKLGGWRPV